jgi:hypothetical protein
MEFRIICDGIPIGTTSIFPLVGLAHAELKAMPAYERVRYHALAAGRRLLDVGIWNVTNGDFAEEFARIWEGGRLGLIDDTGNEIAVASVVVVDWEHPSAVLKPRAVVDARPDMARVESFLRRIGRGGGDRSRPAA